MLKLKTYREYKRSYLNTKILKTSNDRSYVCHLLKCSQRKSRQRTEYNFYQDSCLNIINQCWVQVRRYGENNDVNIRVAGYNGSSLTVQNLLLSVHIVAVDVNGFICDLVNYFVCFQFVLKLYKIRPSFCHVSPSSSICLLNLYFFCLKFCHLLPVLFHILIRCLSLPL